MTRQAITTRAGFTLIEVLMAVFILAVGILGIGALFPAVIKMQRLGADATFGTLTTQSAQAFVAGHSYMPRGFWERWARMNNSTLPPGGLWLPVDVEATSGWAIIGQDDPATGTFDERIVIPLAERLYPSDASGAGEPMLVWDMAVRRVSDGAGAVQVAIFARRIDQRIRLDRGASMYAAMTNTSLSEAQRRWPVSEDLAGVPLQNGQLGGGSRYSQPFTCAVQLPDPRVRDVLRLTGVPSGRAMDRVYAQISVQGQKVVDNYGNIYTVEGPDPRPRANRYDFKITPQVPPDASVQYPVRPSQILLTPQAPASVAVFTVNP